MTDSETEILTVDMEGEGSAGGADDGSNKRKGSPLSKTDAKNFCPRVERSVYYLSGGLAFDDKTRCLT